MTVDEVIVKFKERVLFKQYILKNVSVSKCTNYATLLDIHYDMNVYLGKDRQRAAQHLTATHTYLLTYSMEQSPS